MECDKFYTQEVLQEMKAAFNAKPGDLILILSGDDAMKTRKQLNELRLEMGNQLGLRDKNKFVCLWVVDFPMFEWSDEEGRLMAMHHPFHSSERRRYSFAGYNQAAVRENAYDMVCNGIEVGGGSIRIHDAQLQARNVRDSRIHSGEGSEQFGFLMNAFKYGAPPHGGLAYSRPVGSHLRRSRQYPRLHCIPQEQQWTRCNAGCTFGLLTRSSWMN